MRGKLLIFILTALSALTVSFAGTTAEAAGKTALNEADEGKIRFYSENSYWNGKQVDLIGYLEFPRVVDGQVPAMVIMHGSAGPGFRGKSWGKFLREHGIATFRVDYYKTRGISQGGPRGPKSPYDVYAALKVLGTHPRIDNQRIGVMGFFAWRHHHALVDALPYGRHWRHQPSCIHCAISWLQRDLFRRRAS
jgi:hypothetical protein